MGEKEKQRVFIIISKLLKDRNYTAAYSECKKYFFSHPDDLEVLEIYGFLSANLGFYDDVIEMFTDWIKQHPIRSFCYSLMGLAHFKKGELIKAQALFERALIYNRKDEYAWYGLALFHKTYGEMRRALKSCKKALRYQPNFGLALSLKEELNGQSLHSKIRKKFKS